MNKLVSTILIIAVSGFWILACDTPGTIVPLNEQFFVKMYAGINEGDQFGNDIIATSDGGFLIAGTSVNAVDDTKEILLIKTDNKGNEEWTYGASSDFGLNSISVAKSVVELPGSYLIGGTLSGVVDQSVLIEVDLAGNFLNSTTVLTDEGSEIYSNTLSKITVGASGILVSGRTKHPVSAVDSVNFNGFIGLFDNGLKPIGEGSHYFGVEGDDFVAGAFEVEDQANNIGSDSSKFLAFGSSDFANLGGEKDFYYVGLTQTFGTSPGMASTKFSSTGDQTTSYVTEFNDSYWMIGDSDKSEMFLVGWRFDANSGTDPDWSPALNSGRITDANLPTGATALEGKGIAVQKDNKYVVVGDVIFTAENREIYLGRVNGNFTVDSPVWPKTFGTNTSTYTVSAVTTIADGSIIVVGTADLEPIKKIIVIKTGPNGEMSF